MQIGAQRVQERVAVEIRRIGRRLLEQMLAALVSRIVFLPAGVLADTALWARLVAAGVALGLFLLTGMNLLLGVVAGGAALIAIVAMTGG